MISKRVKAPKNGGSLTRLAHYIAADKANLDKLDHFWMVNCDAGSTLEDLELAITEITNIQEMNTRARGAKTYHLIISLQSGESLPAEDLHEIEKRFAKVLGFEDHQRIVATHTNTENYHMHVAYNMVHPETLNIHHPSHDYYARDQVCRAVEKEYGLQVDHGHERWQEWCDQNPEYERLRKSDKARDLEAHRQEQSFTRMVQQQRAEILADITEAPDWTEVHRVLESKGLAIKPRGAGLVISDGTYHTKASNVSRDLSIKKLEARLGAYQTPAGVKPPALIEQITAQAPAILDDMQNVANWQDIHQVFDRYGYTLRKRGNGLAIYGHEEHVKASDLDRNFTLKRLQEQFGQFEHKDSPLDQVKKAPEMLGTVIAGCDHWKDVTEALALFDLRLHTRGQGYLQATFADKDTLMDAGARFDRQYKHWYIPHDAQIYDFKGFSRGYILSDGQNHTLSDALPGLDAEHLHQKFGDRKRCAQQLLLDTLQTASCWQDVHTKLHEQGFRYTRRKATPYRAESYYFYDGSESIHCKNIAGYSELEQNPKLGAFAPSMVGKQEYPPRPLVSIKNKQQKALWDQFLQRKRITPSLSWKEFLLLMSGVDPMAVAMLHAGRRLLSAMHEVFAPRRAIQYKTREYDALADEPYLPMYICVPSKDRKAARAAGARWDPDMESWFIPHEMTKTGDLTVFNKWPVGLPESVVTISRKKAHNMGIEWN